MAVNPKCGVEVTCSKRPFQKVVKTWSAIGFEWFGANHKALPSILEGMRSEGFGIYEENDILYTFVPIDDIDID